MPDSRHDLAIAIPTIKANRTIASARFAQRFGRPPYLSQDPRASINDFIFNRMIDPDWHPRQVAFVDKVTAKDEARQAFPTLQAPETLLVTPVDDTSSPERLFETLRPFVGTDTVAKPAHASGGTVLLRGVAGSADLRHLHDVARLNYALVLREMQYLTLPRRVIVETMVPTATGSIPDDYKFHCVRGEPLLCQVDHARFGNSWSRILRVPDFTPMDTDDGLFPPAGFHRAPDRRLHQMIDIARALSAPFDFVRVDLYDGADGVYFGELTFTPAAALGVAPSLRDNGSATNPTHRMYSDIMMTALRGNDPGRTRPGTV